MIPSRPPNAEQQTSEVRQRYRILEGANAFNTNLAAQTAATVFDVPIVLTSLNERYRNWFSSVHGVDAFDYRTLSNFCAHANLASDVFVLEDVRRDAHFRTQEAVTGAPHVVFFAGAPLRGPDGNRFGTLCLIDHKPRAATTINPNLLKMFASLISQDIFIRSAGRYAVQDLVEAEADKCTLYDLAMTDPLTSALNRRAFFRFTEGAVRRSRDESSDISALVIDIDHFKQVNDVHGHAAGDEVLSRVVRFLQTHIRDEDLLGRLGGEEFALVFPGTRPEDAAIVANRLRQKISELTFTSQAGTFRITVSIGVAAVTEGDFGIDGALDRGDQALYTAKQNGRDRVEIARAA